jgi:glycosyltransferase involved in cell wall biosynthesis
LKISIVTPSYNQVDFIEETIDSILSQNYTDLEYIVIDGGSTDGSVEKIKKYKKFLAYWHSKPDNGQTEAINYGFTKATGEIFNWVNSDDLMLKGSLDTIADAFKGGNCKVFGGGQNFIDASSRFIKTSAESVAANGLLEDAIGKTYIPQPATFFSRAALEPIFPLWPVFQFRMDMVMWLRYLLIYGHKQVKMTSDPLIAFRLHDNSKTVSSDQQFADERSLYQYMLIKQMNPNGNLSNIYHELDIPIINENHDLNLLYDIKQSFNSNKAFSWFAMKEIMRANKKGRYDLVLKLSRFILFEHPKLYFGHKIYRSYVKAAYNQIFHSKRA